MDPNVLLSAPATTVGAVHSAVSYTVSLGDLVNAVGAVAIIGALIYIGRKLQILDHLDDTVSKMKINVKVIGDFLISSELPFDAEKLQAYSPIQLTDDGKEYLDTVGFTSVFNGHSADFYACIDREQPAGDFDIEAAAIRCVIQLFNNPYFAAVKDYFYNHPSDDRRAFFRVAGIYVRNRYMEHMNVKETGAS